MKKILIIDDEVKITEAFKDSFLFEDDFEIHVLHDGGEARETIASIAPNLIVLDWRLKGDIQGRDVLTWLKETQPDTPVFAVTASYAFKEEI